MRVPCVLAMTTKEIVLISYFVWDQNKDNDLFSFTEHLVCVCVCHSAHEVRSEENL